MSSWAEWVIDSWRVLRFPFLFFVAYVFGVLLYRNRRYLEARARYLAGQDLPYRACDGLLTKAEQDFYRQLKRAIPGGFDIAPKVRLADIITCDDAEWRAGYGGKISQKHVDFVLFHRETSSVWLVIELDDKTHKLRKRRERDEFVDRALFKARIPILHFPVLRFYLPIEIENRIYEVRREHEKRLTTEQGH